MNFNLKSVNFVKNGQDLNGILQFMYLLFNNLLEINVLLELIKCTREDTTIGNVTKIVGS